MNNAYIQRINFAAKQAGKKYSNHNNPKLCYVGKSIVSRCHTIEVLFSCCNRIPYNPYSISWIFAHSIDTKRLQSFPSKYVYLSLKEPKDQIGKMFEVKIRHTSWCSCLKKYHMWHRHIGSEGSPRLICTTREILGMRWCAYPRHDLTLEKIEVKSLFW